MKTLTLTLVAASVGIAGITAPAFAGETVRKSEAVSYKGLNLNTAEGQKLLEQRVEIAARRVCDVQGGPTGTRARRDERTCLARARTSARAQVAAVIEDERRGG
jgi:UrcA family protein